MQKSNRALILGVAVLALGLSRGSLMAQPRPNWGGMDPQQIQQQIQQRMMVFFREQLVVTNDDEWKIIESRLSKVIQTRTEIMFAGMSGLRGMMGGNRGPDSQPGARPGFPGFGQPSPEAEALQKAIETNAPKDQLKAALAAYREARKRKQAELASAQEQLRQVLSLRQEAVMVSMGMLD
jgi:hypothetical protein